MAAEEITISKIIKVAIQSPKNPETNEAATKIKTKGLENWDKKINRGALCPLALIKLGPCALSLWEASVSVVVAEFLKNYKTTPTFSSQNCNCGFCNFCN